MAAGYTYSPSGEANLIPRQDLERDYPLTWAYLNHNRNRLKERDISPEPGAREFYPFGRHQALASAFKGPKIIYSVNQLGDKYGYDSVGIGFASGGTAGEVSITNPRSGYSIEFFLGLLHQKAIEYYLRKRGSPFRGGYYSRGSAVVSDCPVPILDLSDTSHLLIMTTVTNHVRELIEVYDRFSDAVGRSRESLELRKLDLVQKVKAQFDLIWEFHGEDEKIKLPGD